MNPLDSSPELLEALVNRKASGIFVIMNKAKDNLIMDVATGKPFYVTNKKMAEHVCKSCPPGSFVTDALSAFEQLKKVARDRIHVLGTVHRNSR